MYKRQDKIKVTGKKMDQKIYYNHSDYVGGMKETTLKEMLAKKPEKVVELAVKGMLPKGPLGRTMNKKLFVYAGPCLLYTSYQYHFPEEYKKAGEKIEFDTEIVVDSSENVFYKGKAELEALDGEKLKDYLYGTDFDEQVFEEKGTDYVGNEINTIIWQSDCLLYTSNSQ